MQPVFRAESLPPIVLDLGDARVFTSDQDSKIEQPAYLVSNAKEEEVRESATQMTNLSRTDHVVSSNPSSIFGVLPFSWNLFNMHSWFFSSRFEIDYLFAG